MEVRSELRETYAKLAIGAERYTQGELTEDQFDIVIKQTQASLKRIIERVKKARRMWETIL